MKGSDILSRWRILLQDHASRRWQDSEFVLWLNDGCKYITIQRPDACVVNTSMPLVAGTKQSIAALAIPGVRLLDVVRNSAGRAITLVDRNELDSYRPTWHADTAGATENYVFDNRDPKNFYVWPPAVAAATIDVIYSRVPPEVTLSTLGDALPFDDLYLDPLLNYTLFRAYAKDAEATQNAELAAAYLQACNTALGVKTTADVAASPDLNSPGGKVAAGVTLGGT